MVGRDLQSELRLNGYVTTGDIAGPSAATGAWVGGLFGLLAGSALLFVPGAGPLLVLGPLAAAAVGVGQGALLGGVVGALLGRVCFGATPTRQSALDAFTSIRPQGAPRRRASCPDGSRSEGQATH